MESVNQSDERKSVAPNNFPQYAPPQTNPPGPQVADPKFHKPLFSLAKQMMKRLPRTGKTGIKTNQTIHFSHKRSKKKPHFW